MTNQLVVNEGPFYYVTECTVLYPHASQRLYSIHIRQEGMGQEAVVGYLGFSI